MAIIGLFRNYIFLVMCKEVVYENVFVYVFMYFVIIACRLPYCFVGMDFDVKPNW